MFFFLLNKADTFNGLYHNSITQKSPKCDVVPSLVLTPWLLHIFLPNDFSNECIGVWVYPYKHSPKRKRVMLISRFNLLITKI